MAGREYGLGPFEAITSMYVVQGKPSFYSHKFADMIKRSGKYKYKVVEHTENCVPLISLKLTEKVGKSGNFNIYC